MSLAISAQGTLLKIESGTSTGSFSTVPECHKVQSPSIKYDLLDNSSHDSPGFKEYLPGLADGENLVASFWLVPTNAIHVQVRTDSVAKTKRNFKLVLPGGGSGATLDVATYITNLTGTADSNAILSAQMTCKVTGAITWS